MAATNTVWEFRIRKSYVQLLRHLQPSKILPELFQEEILDLDDMEEVKAEKTRKKRAEKGIVRSSGLASCKYTAPL